MKTQKGGQTGRTTKTLNDTTLLCIKVIVITNGRSEKQTSGEGFLDEFYENMFPNVFTWFYRYYY